MSQKKKTESIVREIRRKTRKKYSSEEKIRIVLEGLRGKETKPTLFMYRKIEKPYHIDYAFASRNMFKNDKNFVDIGKPEVWLKHSDHMPVIFTVTS